MTSSKSPNGVPFKSGSTTITLPIAPSKYDDKGGKRRHAVTWWQRLEMYWILEIYFKNLIFVQSDDPSYREISLRHARKWELGQFIEGRLEWNFDFLLHSFCGDPSLPMDRDRIRWIQLHLPYIDIPDCQMDLSMGSPPLIQPNGEST